MKTPGPAAAPSAVWQVAGTRMASATKAAGTQALVPESTHEPSACGGRRRGGLGPAGQDDLADQLGHGRGEDRLAAGHAGAARSCAARRCRSGRWAARRRPSSRPPGRRPPCGPAASTTRQAATKSRPGATDVLAEVDAEQAGVRPAPSRARGRRARRRRPPPRSPSAARGSTARRRSARPAGGRPLALRCS